MFTIYTTDTCPFCVAAKALLESKKLPYKEVNVNDEVSRRILYEQTMQSTVPQIFHMGTHIGGYQQLTEFLASTGNKAFLTE